MVRSVVRSAALAAAVFFASAASAASIASWNVGSGQDKNNFQFTSTTFGSDTIELGLRAQQRQVGSVAPYGDTYYVQPGLQTSPSTPSPRVWWNFDYHAYVSGGLSTLDSLTLTITSTNANTPSSLSGANLLTLAALNDSDVQAGQDRDHYFQNSQNPFFGWFNPQFDPNLRGSYTFTLTATRGMQSVSEAMTVTVVPVPAALPAGLVLLGTALGAPRLRKLIKA